MITTLIEKGWRNRQLKSFYRVSIKWDISKPISSASVKAWVCSLKVLQKFACSTRSSWLLFLHISLIFSSCSSCCLGVTRSSSVLLIIYLGCEKKLLFAVVGSDFEQFRFSSGFISILCWGAGVAEGAAISPGLGSLSSLLWSWAGCSHSVQSRYTRQNISLNRISCVMFLWVQL